MLCKAQRCIQIPAAPALQMLLPVLALPDNASATAHCSQHFPAQGLKPAAARENREWVWGGKGNNLLAQQWSWLSELLCPQLIITDTLELLFRENVTRCSKQRLQTALSALCLGGGMGRDQRSCLLCRAPLPVPHLQSLLLGSPVPSSCPRSQLGLYLHGTSPASRRGRVVSSACSRSPG